MRGVESNWDIPTVPRAIEKFDHYTALQHGWNFSREFLDRLSAACAARLSSNVQTVAIAGSFGRLEGSATSDADYILIVSDAGAAAAVDKEALQEEIKKLNVAPPNKSGVFSDPCTLSQLIEPVGATNERFDELGKRMLLMLESRPVHDREKFEDAINQIFERYARHVMKDGDKEFAFFANDLMRYFRYICVNYESSFWRETDKWPLRNLKLRHSRIIMYAGLLFLIGEASKFRGEEKVSTIRRLLPYTPLERLAWVYQQNADSAFFRVLGLYNVFVSRLANQEWRDKLNEVPYDDRYHHAEFAEMKANSDALVAELMRFLLARRGQWSERFLNISSSKLMR